MATPAQMKTTKASCILGKINKMTQQFDRNGGGEKKKQYNLFESIIPVAVRMKCGQVRRNCRLTVHFSPLTAAFRFFLPSQFFVPSAPSTVSSFLRMTDRLVRIHCASLFQDRCRGYKKAERCRGKGTSFSFHSRGVKRKERGTVDNTVNTVIDERACGRRCFPLCPFPFLAFSLDQPLTLISITRLLITNFITFSI